MDASCRLLVYELSIRRFCYQVGPSYLLYLLHVANFSRVAWSWSRQTWVHLMASLCLRSSAHSNIVGGYTHRTIASAILFTAYCWGNVAVSHHSSLLFDIPDSDMFT